NIERWKESSSAESKGEKSALPESGGEFEISGVLRMMREVGLLKEEASSFAEEEEEKICAVIIRTILLYIAKEIVRESCQVCVHEYGQRGIPRSDVFYEETAVITLEIGLGD